MPSPLPTQAISRRWSRIWVAGELGGLGVVAPVGQSTPDPGRRRSPAGLGPGADLALARAVLGDVVLAETWSEGWSVVRPTPSCGRRHRR